MAGEDQQQYLRSALTSSGFERPDWLMPDIEDGTPSEMKAAAVENVVELVGRHGDSFGGEIWPRVQWAHDDDDRREAGREEIRTLVGEIGADLAGVVVPKVGRLGDVETAARAISRAESAAGLQPGSVELAVLVESARARSALADIARWGNDSRLAALVYGPVDYAAAVGAQRDDSRGRGPQWPALVETLSNEASANGLLAIGAPYEPVYRERAGVRAYDAVGYATHVETDARVGIDASWSLHPKQTRQANRLRMPEPAALDRAVADVERFGAEEASSDGDDETVDEATTRRHRQIVRTVAAICESVGDQATEVYPAGALDQVRRFDG